MALHPNVSVTGDEPIPSGLLWSVSSEGIEPRVIDALLNGLEPRITTIDEELRPLYHAAASVAANFTTTLFALAEELYRRSGIPIDAARTTVARFMNESVERSVGSGAVEAVTGPVARNDMEIVRRQLDSIDERAPEFRALFERLVEATAQLLRPEHLDEVRNLLQQNHHDRPR
jgi:predicted short-subunit dehydrogenase-like oxidoreductase (DUF2520 family)